MDSVRVDFDHGYEVQRWRPLLATILAIPHLIVMSALNALRGALSFVSLFMVLFTKQIPEQMFDLIVMVDRYQWRTMTYVLFMRDEYPPFDFTPAATDPGGDPASVSIDRQAEYNQFAPLYKWLLAIPHFFLLAIFAIGAVFVVAFAWFVVLFTGKWPEGPRDYVVKVARYATRVSAYPLLRDQYPAFGLS